MSRVCPVTGKGSLSGNNRSHSLRATRRKWNTNLQVRTVIVDGKEIEGCITSREFGKNLLLTLKDGRVKEYPLNKVSIYAKKLNPDYMSMTDRIMNKGDFYLDGSVVELDTLVRKDIGYVLQDSISVIKKVGESVKVEICNDEPNIPIFVVKVFSMEVNKLNSKGKQDPKLGKEIIQVARYCDMVDAPIKVSRSISPLKNINIDFNLTEAGVYVLFVQGMDKGLVIKAE